MSKTRLEETEMANAPMGGQKPTKPKTLPSKRPEPLYLKWIVSQLGVLAMMKGQTVMRQRLLLNAEDLADIPQAIMEAVFDRARKELTYYPQVCELRKMAGFLPQQQEASEADQMWAWLTVEYLPQFGADGRRKAVYLRSEAERMNCTKCRGTGIQMQMCETMRGHTEKATVCECLETTKSDAPELPLRLRYALQQLGATVRDALLRIGDCMPEYQGILRKEFGEYYDRAIEVDRVGNLLEHVRIESPELAPASAGAKQLTGEVAEPGEVEAMLRDLVKPKFFGGKPLTDEEWESRRQLLKRQFEEMKAKGVQ